MHRCENDSRGIPRKYHRLTGINFKNIKENEDKIVKTLKAYTGDGWKLDHVTSLTLSQNDNGAGGIFMTRYLLSKPVGKKGF
jgi:hypothetical protein